MSFYIHSLEKSELLDHSILFQIFIKSWTSFSVPHTSMAEWTETEKVVDSFIMCGEEFSNWPGVSPKEGE